MSMSISTVLFMLIIIPFSACTGVTDITESMLLSSLAILCTNFRKQKLFFAFFGKNLFQVNNFELCCQPLVAVHKLRHPLFVKFHPPPTPGPPQ